MNCVGEVAEEQGHHPAVYLSWRKVEIKLWTHKIDGLTGERFHHGREDRPARLGSLEVMMSLLKIAHVPAAIVEPGATVVDAVSVMAREGVGAVAVVEKAEKSELRGIFTERDVMLRVVQQKRDPRETQVREVMTSPVETASEETTAAEALTLMLDRHLRHLPIVGKNGQLLGMLSIRNLLEDQVEDLKRTLNSLDQYLLNDSPGG